MANLVNAGQSASAKCTGQRTQLSMGKPPRRRNEAAGAARGERGIAQQAPAAGGQHLHGSVWQVDARFGLLQEAAVGIVVAVLNGCALALDGAVRSSAAELARQLDVARATACAGR